MERSERNARKMLTAPATALAATVFVSVVLARLPEAKTQPLRNAWRETLRPGELVLAAGRDWLLAARDKVRDAVANNSNPSAPRIAALSERVRRLELDLLIERNRQALSPPFNLPQGDVTLAGHVTTNEATPLVVARSVSARVLGRQAKAFLVDREILDLGKLKSVQPKALVVDADEAIDLSQVVDRGADAGIKPNRLVLSGRRIWGRIAAVGPHTSTLQRTNDAGYRDLAQLASLQNGRLQFSARGILVGTGQQYCKLEQVETTEPVTVGDLVFTADDGVLDSPLLYGRVTKLERKPGAAHWEIWVEPAVTSSAAPARVAILQFELNPTRLSP
ncbi:MAG: rod shape-determining protein MreC [Pirellulales bacterium]|nr:rod shape-determining protein MreC [Pirellulales bacterium]